METKWSKQVLPQPRPFGIKNSRGQITIDFLFAFIIALGIFVVLFSMTFTLSVVEMVQYITFSSARAHLAGNLTMNDQVQAARSKYKQLTSGNNSPLSSLVNGGWFSVSNPQSLDIRSGPQDFSNDLAGGDDKRRVFMGVSTIFQAKLLNNNVAFLGATDPEGEDGFKTRINAILIREPSQKECLDWYEKRREQMAQLPAAKAPYYVPEKYIAIEDNGC